MNVTNTHESSTNEVNTPVMVTTIDGAICATRELIDGDSSYDTITCCIHHNWTWVVSEALHNIISSDDRRQIVKRQSELPSQKEKNKEQREKPCYALIKLDIERITPTLRVSSIWVTSPCLGFLDAKDRLCRELHHVSKQSLMPSTSFIPWDVTSIEDIPDFPTHPALLKAALGSGGYGLYFVHTKQHVLSIAQAHTQRAKQFDGFLEVRRTHIHSYIIPTLSHSLSHTLIMYAAAAVAVAAAAAAAANTIHIPLYALTHPSYQHTL